MKHLLVPANRDATVMIREDSTHLIHVRLSKVDYNPNDPTINSESSRIVTYRPDEFEKNERMKYERIGIDWVRAAGFAKAYVVHDGRLEAKKIKEVKAEEIPAEPDFNKVIAAEVQKELSKKATKARKVKSMVTNFKKEEAK